MNEGVWAWCTDMAILPPLYRLNFLWFSFYLGKVLIATIAAQ